MQPRRFPFARSQKAKNRHGAMLGIEEGSKLSWVTRQKAAVR